MLAFPRVAGVENPQVPAVPHHSRRRAASDVVVQIVTRILNLLLGIVVTAVVVRTLGDAGYGQWSTILVSLELIGYFMAFGMQSVVIREAAADPARENEWIGAMMLMRLLMAGPVVAIALVVLLLIQDSHEMLIAGLILTLGMPFGNTGGLQLIFELRVNNRIPMLILTLKSLMWAVCVFVIAATDRGMVALALALVITNAIGSLILGIAALRLTGTRLRPRRTHLRHLLRVGLPVGISGVLVIAYARIDQVLVFQLAGSEEAGLYGAVYHVLQQAHFLPTSVLTTLAPIIAASWPGNRARMTRAVRSAAEILTIVSLGAVAVAIVTAEPLITLVFGEEFAPAAPALPVLGGAFVLICYGYLTGNLLLVLGQQRKMVVVAVLALIANVVGNVLLIPSTGFMGAAWITLVTEAVVIALSFLFIARALGLRRPSPGRLPHIALAAVMLLLVMLGVDALGAPLVVELAVACLVYPVLLLGLRAIQLDEIRSLLRRELPA